MNKFWRGLQNAFLVLLAVATILMVLVTLVTVATVDKADRSFLGFRFYTVLSDSMKATDFAAGDVIVVQEINPDTLQEGQIISFISRDPLRYGETVTHKIRTKFTDENGYTRFITYGTTKGNNDSVPVDAADVLGVYRLRIPKGGYFFKFLSTPTGFVLCVILPLGALIIWQAAVCIEEIKKLRRKPQKGEQTQDSGTDEPSQEQPKEVQHEGNE